MSETAPRSNPRLDNFEKVKAQTEQEIFEQNLYGDAGTTDFSEEARRRVEEADEYERHMEEMAKRGNFDPEDTAAEAARRRGYTFGNLNDEPSPAYERELETMVAETREKEQLERAEREAFAAKIEESPILRMADKISREIQELRNKTVDPDTYEADKQRITHLEDRLEALLDRYTRTDGHDLAAAEFMIDRDYEGARERNKDRTPVDSSDSKDNKEPKKGDKDDDTDKPNTANLDDDDTDTDTEKPDVANLDDDTEREA
jgi:hypothetical protein